METADIVKYFNEGLNIKEVAFDMSKGFDAVNYDIFLQ